MSGWYVQDKGKTHGPFSVGRLATLAQKGRVTSDHQVRRGSDGQWMRLGDLTELLVAVECKEDAPPQIDQDDRRRQLTPASDAVADHTNPSDLQSSVDTKRTTLLKIPDDLKSKFVRVAAVLAVLVLFSLLFVWMLPTLMGTLSIFAVAASVAALIALHVRRNEVLPSFLGKVSPRRIRLVLLSSMVYGGFVLAMSAPIIRDDYRLSLAVARAGFESEHERFLEAETTLVAALDDTRATDTTTAKSLLAEIRRNITLVREEDANNTVRQRMASARISRDAGHIDDAIQKVDDAIATPLATAMTEARLLRDELVAVRSEQLYQAANDAIKQGAYGEADSFLQEYLNSESAPLRAIATATRDAIRVVQDDEYANTVLRQLTDDEFAKYVETNELPAFHNIGDNELRAAVKTALSRHRTPETVRREEARKTVLAEQRRKESELERRQAAEEEERKQQQQNKLANIGEIVEVRPPKKAVVLTTKAAASRFDDLMAANDNLGAAMLIAGGLGFFLESGTECRVLDYHRSGFLGPSRYEIRVVDGPHFGMSGFIFRDDTIRKIE